MQIVCSPNRSTQEWPPTWCTNGSSITPFPGYGVPSACIRASRAGLILTPHRITELGGPTSVGRQEARPLVWLPILKLLCSHGGATGLLLESSREKQRAGQEGQSQRRRNPLFPRFSLSEDELLNSSVGQDNLRVCMCNKK